MLESIRINKDEIEHLARLATKYSRLLESGRPVTMLERMSREDIVRYAVIIHAIDYGLGSQKEKLHSAILAKIERNELTASELSKIDKNFLEERILGDIDLKIHELDKRVNLLRDIGIKVSSLYGGKFYKLIVVSHGQLGLRGKGFLDLVEDFQAYRVPGRSKPLSLAMYLYYAGVLPSHDLWNADVVVDARLLGLAIRSGILELDRDTLERISAGMSLDVREDYILRMAAVYAFRLVANRAGLDPFTATRVLRYIYESLCKPGIAAEREECLASKRPLLRVRDPLPPQEAWWD